MEKKRRRRGKMARVEISPPTLERERTVDNMGGVGQGVRLFDRQVRLFDRQKEK
jgi:hypothetical protein